MKVSRLRGGKGMFKLGSHSNHRYPRNLRMCQQNADVPEVNLNIT